ncbi:Cell morphogenesis protein PAG1, partial [Quaeritorhiza haematococci]
MAVGQDHLQVPARHQTQQQQQQQQQQLVEDWQDQEHATYEAAAITSSLPVIYKCAQAMVSTRLANEHVDRTYDMLSEMMMRLEMVATGDGGPNSGYPQGVKDILISMVPWIRNIDLGSLPLSQEDSTAVSGARQPPDQTQTTGSQPSKNTPGGIKKSTITAEAILSNLFYLTIKYGDEYVYEIENLWVQLVERAANDGGSDRDGGPSAGSHDDSPDDMIARLRQQRRMMLDEDELHANLERQVNMIVEFVLGVGVKKRNPKFVNYAKKVVVFLARTIACGQLVDALISRISPKTLVPANASENNPRPSTDSEWDAAAALSAAGGGDTPVWPKPNIKETPPALFYVADLEQVLVEMPKRPAFSKGQLACVLLVDLAIEVGTVALQPQLPLLLHVIFVQLDHFITLICEQNRLLLINLIQSIVPRELAAERIDTLCATLNLKEGKRFWPYEDISYKTREIESTKQLAALVKEVLDVFTVVEPHLAQAWGETALAWGTYCPVRHVACRSLQIFRTLLPAFNQRMLGELLYRLSNTVADLTEEIQGFAMEILLTLNVMFDSLDEQRVVLFPQFFWACVACLHSPHEWEFLEAVSLLSKFLSRVNLNDASCRNVVLINLPTKWRGQFVGLQPLLLRGLNSATCERQALQVITALVPLENDSLVDVSPARVLFAVLAHLPRLLQGFEADPSVDGGSEAQISVQECLDFAAKLAALAEMKNYDGIARLLWSYSKRKFRSKDDFLRQFVTLIRESFFPTYKSQALMFLVGLLFNKLPFYRRRTLKVLKLMFPALDSRKEAEEMVGEELVAPLLALLQTDMGAEALEVLDEAMRNSISSTETNLRIVFGNKSIYKIAKEVAGAGASSSGIVGIGQTPGVEESGWHIKDFTGSSKIARYNIAGVASTCSGHDFYSGTGHGVPAFQPLSPDLLDPLSLALPSFRRQSALSLIAQSPSAADLTALNDDRDASMKNPASSWDVEEFDGKLLDALEELDNFFGQEELFFDAPEEASDSTAGRRPGFPDPRDGSGKPPLANGRSESSAHAMLDPSTTHGALSQANPHLHHSPRKPSVTSISSDVSYSAETLEGPLSKEVSSSSSLYEVSTPSATGSDTSLHANGASISSSNSSRQLATHPASSVSIIFRLKTPFGDVVRDPEFKHWLMNDLSKPLKIDKNRIVIERVEADIPVANGGGGGSEAAAAENGGTLVTISILKDDDGRNPNAGAAEVPAVAYAEQLISLVVGDNAEDDGQIRDHLALYQGVVTWNLDATWRPQIVI